MKIPGTRTLGGLVVSMALLVLTAPLGLPPAAAVEVGEPAPNFTLPSTFGKDISLSDFHGKKFVLLEFYGADFAPA
jgi:thioredoxin-dependent peroxiredoxin